MARSPNVVLLNEHPAEQAFLRYFLSSKGIASSSLSHRAGLDALAALAPDLVILDDAAGGAEGAQRVKARFPNARVALVADTADRGGDAALRRPLDLSSLERDLLPLLGGPLGIEAPRKRVLVVDDDQDVLSLIRRILEASGCAVTCVPDPKDLLRHPPGDRYDLVLLDVRMPDVNGLEACYLLRQHYGEDLRICMMTAAHDPETVKRAAEMGADGWLTKPIHRVNLLALVGLAKRPLPERRAATVPAVQKPARKATAKRPRVLVVDDDDDVLGYCRLVLGGAGAVVDAVRDSSKLSEVLPEGGSYDLVILDVFMPGVSGIELLRRFSADVRNCASRMYVVSAADDQDLRAEARRCGADGFLKKPLLRKTLLDLLSA
ncbi:MAG: response regulator [Deltaproteobacteria bacterium]|nr:MAG: response regulator [Deltaproteobacteria bacterium]TMB35462.1 MAG: response regulator [Deltaproteobacteria bacterium]